jgi:hypothetical protein
MHVLSSSEHIARTGLSPQVPTILKQHGRQCIHKAKVDDELYSAVNMTLFPMSATLVSSPPSQALLNPGGHNLICVGGIAAALETVAKLKQNPEQNGEVVLLGTPAEEGSSSSTRNAEHN